MSAVSSPPYKTARYLRELVQRFKDTLDKAYPDFELLTVDDGDPDNARCPTL
jgi:hypothetical protein